MNPDLLQAKSYGTEGPLVFVLHGGPAAVGTAAPIALGLAARFRVIEPFQRGSSSVALTVARHVADLDALIEARREPARPVLVGHSWGAMLALAYGAAHPGRVQALVLVGCGTFDKACRNRMNETIAQRTREGVRAVYDYDTDRPPEETRDLGPFDTAARTETWNDMLRLQENGTYPAAFAAVTAPVLMLHGSYDPHPGGMIRDSLRPFIKGLEYVELDRCGHDPWRERGARDRFFRIMVD